MRQLEPQTREQILEQINLLADEVDADGEENRVVQEEIDGLYKKLDALGMSVNRIDGMRAYNHQQLQAPLLRRLLGSVARWCSPGYSQCLHCGRPWNLCKAHHTFYTTSAACFPLCERCWCELTPEQRLSYYRHLWAKWQQDDSPKPPEIWVQIEQAVLSGK